MVNLTAKVPCANYDAGSEIGGAERYDGFSIGKGRGLSHNIGNR